MAEVRTATAATQLELPVISYTKLTETQQDGTTRSSASTEERHRLFEALHSTGFAYLELSQPEGGVNQDAVNKLFDHNKYFFSRPFEEKITIKGQMDKGRGPSQGYSNPAKLAKDPRTSDIKEFFGIYRDDDTVSPNQWLPDSESQVMRSDLVRFFNNCHHVILDLLAALAEEIGLPSNALHEYVEERNHFIACLHYPETQADSFQNRTRAAAHTDYGCLTLLFNDSGEGLQVMRQNGVYEYVPRKEGCAVLNVGDLTSRFFNGILPSTMHRVVEPPSTSKDSSETIPSRYSLAFFGHYNLTTLVKPLDVLVSEDCPAKFEPIEAGEHVKARVRQLHLAGHSLRDGDRKEKTTSLSKELQRAEVNVHEIKAEA